MWEWLRNLFEEKYLDWNDFMEKVEEMPLEEYEDRMEAET